MIANALIMTIALLLALVFWLMGELKRDLYTANFVFLFKSRVPNELIPINPLGLTITYFREDEAFK